MSNVIRYALRLDYFYSKRGQQIYFGLINKPLNWSRLLWET